MKSNLVLALTLRLENCSCSMCKCRRKRKRIRKLKEKRFSAEFLLFASHSTKLPDLCQIDVSSVATLNKCWAPHSSFLCAMWRRRRLPLAMQHKNLCVVIPHQTDFTSSTSSRKSLNFFLPFPRILAGLCLHDASQQRVVLVLGRFSRSHLKFDLSCSHSSLPQPHHTTQSSSFISFWWKKQSAFRPQPKNCKVCNKP